MTLMPSSWEGVGFRVNRPCRKAQSTVGGDSCKDVQQPGVTSCRTALPLQQVLQRQGRLFRSWHS